MNKAIIITRSSEYSDYVDFKVAIEKPEFCEYNRTGRNLMKFLAARKAWEDKRSDCNSDIDAYECLLEEKLSLDDGIPIEDIMYEAIKKKMETITPDESIAPYASFHVGQEWEVILVLCDRIGIGRDDSVFPVDLFLECICEDLQPFDTTDKTDNVLYIHDKQLGESGEDTIVENHKLKSSDNNNDNNKFIIWADSNKHKFTRIAQFVHEYDKGGFWDVNILTKDFLGNNPYDE